MLSLAPYKRYLVAAAVLVGAFVVTGYAVGRHYRAQLAVAQDSVRTAHVALTSALTAARAESAWATSLSILGAQQATQAARLAAQAKLASDTANVWRGRYLAATKAAPDTCTFVSVAANGLVNSVDAVNSALRVELDSTRASRDSFHASADSARAAFATLSVPVARVDNAAQRLAGASKEPFLSRITPKPYIGALAGFTAQGRPVIAFGIGLGWHL